MTPPEPEILRDRGRSLEDEFFRREDQRLLARLNELKTVETTRAALAKASGIDDPAVLDALLGLGIRAETVAALSVVPLVEVAWADGSLDAKERGAILEGARQSGIAPGSTAHALLEPWLERRPDAKLLSTWLQFVRDLRDRLSAEEAARLKSSLLDQARAVATASGGVLGLGAKVSNAEAAMLARLESAFTPGT
jgi:hypothetical protein